MAIRVPTKKATAKKAVKMAAPKKVPAKKAAQIYNHVAISIDESSSMAHNRHAVQRAVPALITNILATAKQAGQTVFISIYGFSDAVRCRATNMNAVEAARYARDFEFMPNGMTALLDGTARPIEDFSRDEAVRVRGGSDHSYLIYVVTDGEENQSVRYTPASLRHLINHLGDRFTVGALVPAGAGPRAYVKNLGIPDGNIEAWDHQTEKGVEHAFVNTVGTSYAGYTQVRSLGQTQSSNLFKVDAANLGKATVKENLDEVLGDLLFCQKDDAIRDFVESRNITYVKGEAFYELVKTEKVQPYKELVLIDKKSLKRYGGPGARSLLGFGHATGEIKLTPGDHGNWRIFVQSTSVNRKIPSGTSVFVRAS